MTTVFLSYSHHDHFFADLAEIKLAESGIRLWRDRGQLRAGKDWRNGIEQGISESLAVIVALSSHSSESSYVTYEWAYAIGNGRPIIPVKLTECKIHPKLEPIQYLDFTVPGALPWESLVQRIQEIEGEGDGDAESGSDAEPPPDPDASTVTAILAYLDQRGYQMMSFERIRQRIDESLTDERLSKLIDRHSNIFRRATLKGGKPGLARLIP